MPTLLLSDLHLDPRQPAVIDRFLRLLDTAPRRVEALYVLGDLFELWIGDDYVAPGLAGVLEGLRAASGRGLKIHVMRGNRDFLLGQTFAERTGCELLDDPVAFDGDGVSALLCHGDGLCTDDGDYQRFRTLVRDAAWQRDFLAKTVEERLRLARAARNMSREATRDKSDAIMDVNPATVTRLMRARGASVLIHGHTHRPGLHRVELDGVPARRIVLGDWPERATLLVADAGALRLESLETWEAASRRRGH